MFDFCTPNLDNSFLKKNWSKKIKKISVKKFSVNKSLCKKGTDF